MASQDGDKRFASVLLGSGAAMKAQAMELILSETAGRPETSLLNSVVAATA